MNRPPTRHTTLLLALIALAALYGYWFLHDKHWLATQLVFTAPPLLLAIALRLGWRQAPFWSGVLALFWFSHGVMSAWAHRETALLAWAEIVLSLLVVALASGPGIRARFGRRRA
ncbi:DUF2069 domain-containing protein [Flavobacterium sp. MXW15]|uniref:DUF2069 domain-containing protein n=1 Tax=Xanthomonas chitinilytica TaxID=2989819 RepID=A0ABT3JS61_9XANT|nr:DUF2069 domain-containing protein [Xanthomonas sp. H13-6]MCW4454088.1 DUF2069 domain-containing protein [Flavobacterium sp. MXW15]MCW4471322.1 DUF2069 domain-containing protein [Xanthomonas sp. H13-6]